MLSGNFRELAIAVAMLYWAEGSKRACEFINSDGKMIQTYLFVLRNVLNVPEAFLHPTMRIFSGMNEKKCVSYWSRITKISKRNFTIRLNDGGKRGRTEYGMCRITVRKGQSFLKTINAIRDRFFDEIIQEYNVQ